MKALFLIFSIVLLNASPLLGHEEIPIPTTPAPVTQTQPQITQHTLQIDGKELRYQAKAGTLLLYSDEGKPIANIFYVAYHKERQANEPASPVTFCFDGGPGNASAWLHMGGIGPKKIDVQDGRFFPESPYTYSDNPDTLLDLTDLVFVDALGTGYSRVAGEAEAKTYYSSKEDTRLLSDFIRVYLTQNDLWNTPKYLMGQGFGGFRACDISYYLHEESFIYLNGLVLLSSILNYQTISDPEDGNDLPYPLSLPSYAAALNYHDHEKQVDLKETEAFAEKEYTLALFQGSFLENERAKKLANELSRYTGLKEDLWLKSKYKVDTYTFSNELLRKDRRAISLSDSRVTSLMRNMPNLCSYKPAGELLGAFSSVINSYLSQELKYTSSEEYLLQANVCPWKYGHNSNQYPGVSDKLRFILCKNPQLKLFSGAGYYDLVSPYYAIHYALTHLYLESSIQKRLTEKVYSAGHLLSLDKKAGNALKTDLKNFYQAKP